MNEILTLILITIQVMVVKTHLTLGYRTRPLWPFGCYAVAFTLAITPRMISMAYLYNLIVPPGGLETINTINTCIWIIVSSLFFMAGTGMVKVLRLNTSPLDLIADPKE